MTTGLFSHILKVAVTCPPGKMRSVSYDQARPNKVIFFKVIPLASDSEAPIGITVPLNQKLTPESAADLRAIYGLSGAELRILSDLIDGKTVTDSAQSTNTSVFTARTHLRNIYQKLRVSTREAMFNLLAPLL
jgi:DNA-binding CsgD family transcriptional regulator